MQVSCDVLQQTTGNQCLFACVKLLHGLALHCMPCATPWHADPTVARPDQVSSRCRRPGPRHRQAPYITLALQQLCNVPLLSLVVKACAFQSLAKVTDLDRRLRVILSATYRTVTVVHALHTVCLLVCFRDGGCMCNTHAPRDPATPRPPRMHPATASLTRLPDSPTVWRQYARRGGS